MSERWSHEDEVIARIYEGYSDSLVYPSKQKKEKFLVQTLEKRIQERYFLLRASKNNYHHKLRLIVVNEDIEAINNELKSLREEISNKSHVENQPKKINIKEKVLRLFNCFKS